LRRRRPTITPEQARAGDIVLRRPWEHAVFISGLAAAVLLGIVAVAWACWP